MHIHRCFYSLAVAGLAHCQTPPGYPPNTHRALTVTYGDLTITPDVLVSENETTLQPAVSFPEYREHHDHRTCEEETYMLLMLDLSISNENLPASLTNAHTVPGIGANRTTYLHWFQGNLTRAFDKHSSALIPSPNTETMAPYISPSPNPGDIPHTYAFYLFRQPKGFVLTGINAGRDLYSTSLTATDRLGFSVQDVAEERGVELVAGVYLREQAS